MKIIKSALISWFATIFLASLFLIKQDYTPEKISFDANENLAYLLISLLVSLPALFAIVGHYLFFEKKIIVRLLGGAITGGIIFIYSGLVYNFLPKDDIINFAIPYYVCFIVLFLLINLLMTLLKKIVN